MSTYEAEVAKIAAACDLIWRAETAVDTRRAAIARAWANRPGGVEWSDLLAAVNARLHPDARLTYATARSDERLARAKAPAP